MNPWLSSKYFRRVKRAWYRRRGRRVNWKNYWDDKLKKYTYIKTRENYKIMYNNIPVITLVGEMNNKVNAKLIASSLNKANTTEHMNN